jgi:hypothetical protein
LYGNRASAVIIDINWKEKRFMRVTRSLVAAASALLLAIPLAAADTSPAKTTKKTVTVKTATVRSVWPPETLSGKISMVDPGQNLVVVETSGGVPFDMVVTRNTRMMSGNRAVSLQNLKQDTNQTVTVKFIPKGRGDVAETIRIGG